MMLYTIELSKQARKDLKKIPDYIILKLQFWIDSIEQIGLYETRKIPGFHDEPLQGNREKQRSIRLSKGYRAIYEVDEDKKLHIIRILEINKHEY